MAINKELIETVDKIQKQVGEEEKKKKDLGSKENPYTLFQTRQIYDYMKTNHTIDKDDLYESYRGGVKVIPVDLEKD